MSEPQQQAASTLGTEPIPGEEPGGIAPAEDPLFEELSAEIHKLDSLSAEDPPKWPRVVELGTTLLQEKSKSLQVAAYRAFGQFNTEGYAGLEDGLIVVRDLLKNFWETMHPPVKRLRGRKQALEWLADRAVTLLESAPPNDPSGLEACVAAMEEVDATARELFDTPPGITKLLVKLREIAAGGEDEGEGEEGLNGGVTIAASTPVKGAPGAITTRQQAFDQLKLIIEFLRKNDPHSPVSYLLERAHKWGQLPYEELYKDLMSRHGDARQMIWWVLGIKDEN